MSTRDKIISFSVIALIFFGIGFGIRSTSSVSNALAPMCKPTHAFINSYLDCLNNADATFGRIDESNKEVNDYIVSQIDGGSASRISVFFRDLKTNRWYGINQSDMFSPGSLLKLPLAMAYFKYSELNPSIMQQQFTLKLAGASANNVEHYKAPFPLANNSSYTVHNLIAHMISDSDNDATDMLYGHIDSGFYQTVMQDLGVNIPATNQGGIRSDFYTASSYSGILRQLYNSSYLSLDNSNALLGMMASSTFDQGIVAGVPQGVTVANKFGEGSAVDQSTGAVLKDELHDCGIVYNPHSPYIICVMTEGSSFDTLAGIIAHISQIVWNSDATSNQ